MAFEIVFSPQAVEDRRRLNAREWAMVKGALEIHLRHEPRKESKSRIKRLRGLARPQYRLRVGEIRVFYDVVEKVVELLASAEVTGRGVARRGRRTLMKKVPLARVKDQLSRYLNAASKEEIIITKHGRPAGVLIGFASEDDWFDYKLENDPRFLARIASARRSLRAGKGTRLEELSD